MSWQRRWAERVAVAIPFGLLMGLVMDAWYKSSPFPSEITGAVSILITLPFVAPVRLLVRDQRRRSLQYSPKRS
jgi:hypothetical protein